MARKSKKPVRSDSVNKFEIIAAMERKTKCEKRGLLTKFPKQCDQHR